MDNKESSPNIAVNSSNNSNNEEEVLEIKKVLLVNAFGRHFEGVADALIDKV